MTTLKDLHRRWSKDAAYKAEYDALDEGFRLARALIGARTRAGLSQTELARRMKTSQSYVARIEGGQVRPSTDALETGGYRWYAESWSGCSETTRRKSPSRNARPRMR